jgi:hypothetical protein
MSSASEAELAALYYGCQQATPIRVTLEEMGHPQPAPTPVTTDNITVQGLTLGTMTPKASKSNDQQFNWLKCHNAQCQFKYLWRKVFSIELTTPANTTWHNTIKTSAHFMSSTATSCPHSKKLTCKPIDYLRGCAKYPHI